eukprot:TRINITY_DN1674_c0_g1_i1.p1 TRINITY_DN1674_c0_g1~~TRINITY_DN1674_c0_g1_i1.p1  ORF type:complete len:325 (-),score=49.66 TRINITY_DN1674_c0_g1_i1:27-938(-)
MAEQEVFINGKFVAQSQAKVSVYEYGFNFGAGVYDVARVEQGKIYQLTEHVQRLLRSAEHITLHIPLTESEIKQISEDLVKRNNIHNGLVYYQATYGDYNVRSHYWPATMNATFVVFTMTPPAPPETMFTQGITLKSVPDIRWKRCDIKSVLLLPNIMTLNLAIKEGFNDIVFVDDDTVTESALSNILCVKDNVVYSPPDSGKILSGITRLTLFRLCEENHIPVKKQHFSISFLKDADEVFLTNTSKELVPVRAIDDRKIPHSPGPLTIRLMDLLVQSLEKELGVVHPKRDLIKTLKEKNHKQ